MNCFGNLYLLLAQADAVAKSADETIKDAAEQSSSSLGWLALAIFLGVIFVPFLLGQLIERWLRLKDVAFRIGVVLFALTIGLAPFVTRWVTQGNLSGAIPLGIDLAGGTNLIYQVDREAAEALGKQISDQTMEKLVSSVAKRVNPSGTEEVTVRRVGLDRLEVIIPGADAEKTALTKKNIVELGSLEFSIVVNRIDHPDLYALGQAQLSQPEKKFIEQGGVIKARWVPVAFSEEDKTPKITALGSDELIRPATVDGQPGYEILVINETDPDKKITGDLLVSAQEEFQASGPVVGFTFNQQGGYRFRRLTTRYQPKEGSNHHTKLAILLSDRVHSAPRINQPIGARGVIEGRFTSAEIDSLVGVLNAGALDVPLIKNPVSEFFVSPLLGKDVREKGKNAIVLAGIMVFVFMLLYYRKAGVIADVCLLINVILVLGIMSLIDATFTLPGLAGLVLTIGMAVDANVLIFERIREELNKGASLRMSINNGFSKALSTIVDANLTTLITAVVLYVIGTDQVKGFAVTLFIGIVMSMFTSLYVGKLIFDVLERKRWLKSLAMASLVSAPKINFLAARKTCAAISLLIIGAGMAAVIARGSENFDIDFSGGVMVTFRFEGKQPEIDEARSLLEAQLGKGITVEELSLNSEFGKPQIFFKVRTTEDDAELVSRQIDKAFAGSPYLLVRQHLTIGKLIDIPASESESDAPADLFAGGFEQRLSVSEPMTALGIKEQIADALKQVNKDRYGDTSDMIEVRAKGVENPNEKTEQFIVRVKNTVTRSDMEQAMKIMQDHLQSEPFFTEKNTFDTKIGKEMKITAVMAMVISLIAIVAYLWFRFQRVTFGLAAIAALVHDVLAVLGLVALASYASNSTVGQMLGLVNFKINLPMVAAFLTIVGYSLNDTIVVFDRIREIRGKNPALTVDMVNTSLNQTLSRTLLTSLTTLIVVVILYAIGGEGIHGFAFCLMLGVLVGTYSSIYVASPVLLWLMNRDQARATATAKPATT